MTKKVATFSCILIGIIGIVMMPIAEVRAAENNEIEAEDSSVFQKVSDVINGKYEVKTVPSKKIRIFQIMADGIGEIERTDINPALK